MIYGVVYAGIKKIYHIIYSNIMFVGSAMNNGWVGSISQTVYVFIYGGVRQIATLE